jgi:hypothetical protein
MGPVAHRIKLFVGAPHRCSVRECLQQLVMAGTGLMNSRKNRIDNAESACLANALRSQPIAGTHTAVSACGVFQCAYDRRADRDNAPAMRPRALDGGSGRF